MKSRILIFALFAGVSAFIAAPALVHGSQAPAAEQHDQHHSEAATAPAQGAGDQRDGMMTMMARMKATELKLDELVKKMNAAKGTEKVDAIADLLTTLVQDHRAMHKSMMMGGMRERSESAAPAPK